MFSTLVGCAYGPKAEYGAAHRVASTLDFGLFLTLVVVGLLAALNAARLPIGCSEGWAFCTVGAIGLLILAVKNIRSVNYLSPKDKESLYSPHDHLN